MSSMHPLEVLYWDCETCHQHLPWKRKAKSDILVSSCCGLIYNAEPLHDGRRFQVRYKKADLGNVLFLSVVDAYCPEDPPA